MQSKGPKCIGRRIIKRKYAQAHTEMKWLGMAWHGISVRSSMSDRITDNKFVPFVNTKKKRIGIMVTGVPG